MAKDLDSRDTKIDQKKDLVGDQALRDRSDIVQVDKLPAKSYADALEFNEEPITIRLEPSTDKNASKFFPVWVNGKGAEMLQRGQWTEVGYLPVNVTIIIKRKVLAVIIGAKIDTVYTEVVENPQQDPENKVKRFTSPLHSFSILHDPNPMGAAWVQELLRRNT